MSVRPEGTIGDIVAVLVKATIVVFFLVGIHDVILP